MNDHDIRESLKQAFDVADRAPPNFESMLADAEAGLRRRRIRTRFATVAAAAVLALVVGLWSSKAPVPGDDFRIADALLNSTSWAAPSDVLLPDHQFDIYREVSFPMPSTNSQEGTLL